MYINRIAFHKRKREKMRNISISNEKFKAINKKIIWNLLNPLKWIEWGIHLLGLWSKRKHTTNHSIYMRYNLYEDFQCWFTTNSWSEKQKKKNSSKSQKTTNTSDRWRKKRRQNKDRWTACKPLTSSFICLFSNIFPPFSNANSYSIPYYIEIQRQPKKCVTFILSLFLLNVNAKR